MHNSAPTPLPPPFSGDLMRNERVRFFPLSSRLPLHQNPPAHLLVIPPFPTLTASPPFIQPPHFVRQQQRKRKGSSVAGRGTERMAILTPQNTVQREERTLCSRTSKKGWGLCAIVASLHTYPLTAGRRAGTKTGGGERRHLIDSRTNRPTGANKLALIKRETQGWKKGAPSCKGGASGAKVSLSFCYKSPLGVALSVCFFGGLFCSAFSQRSTKTFSQDSDRRRAKKSWGVEGLEKLSPRGRRSIPLSILGWECVKTSLWLRPRRKVLVLSLQKLRIQR